MKNSGQLYINGGSAIYGNTIFFKDSIAAKRSQDPTGSVRNKGRLSGRIDDHKDGFFLATSLRG